MLSQTLKYTLVPGTKQLCTMLSQVHLHYIPPIELCNAPLNSSSIIPKQCSTGYLSQTPTLIMCAYW